MPHGKEACHMVHSRLSSSASSVNFVSNSWTGLELTSFKLGRILNENCARGSFVHAGRNPLALD